jgi:hypothetical protein
MLPRPLTMSKKPTYADPDPFTIVTHVGASYPNSWPDDRDFELGLASGPVAAGIAPALRAKTLLDLAITALRYQPAWTEIADRALAWGVAAYEYADEATRADQEYGQTTSVRELPELGQQKVREPLHYSMSSPLTWLELMSLALIRGNAAAQASLARVDLKLFGDMADTRTLPHRTAAVRALIEHINGDDAAALATLAAGIEAADARARKQKGVLGDYATLLDRPPLEVHQAIILADADGVNQRLADGLRAHRKFYDSKRGMNRGDRPLRDVDAGFASLRLQGLIVLARRHGLEVGVRSGYVHEQLFVAV